MTTPARLTIDDPEPLLRLLSTGAAIDTSVIERVQLWAIAAIFCAREDHRKQKWAELLVDRLEVPDQFVARLTAAQTMKERVSVLSNHFTVVDVPVRAGPQEPLAERLLGERLRAHGEARNALYMSLVEMLRNVVQHSRAKAAVAVSQSRWENAREFAQVAVADNGIGIFASLKGHHPTLTDARAALDKALWPHISGTFDEGLTGHGENAGLGLFMIAEMTKLIGGRLLISTRGATLSLVGDPDDVEKHTLKFLDAEYPGTLVVFDIPVEQVYDFDGILETIRERVKERTPKRATHQWLKFEDANSGIARFSVAATENTQEATEFARDKLRPIVFNGKSFVLDFSGVEICTQSFLHALLYEVLRLAWATKTPIYVVNAKPAVRSGLELLENYALGG